jgi:hypothetical protein
MLDDKMRYLLASRRWMTDFGLEGPLEGRSHYEIFPEIPERWKHVHRLGLSGQTVKAEEDPFSRNGREGAGRRAPR